MQCFTNLAWWCLSVININLKWFVDYASSSCARAVSQVLSGIILKLSLPLKDLEKPLSWRPLPILITKFDYCFTKLRWYYNGDIQISLNWICIFKPFCSPNFKIIVLRGYSLFSKVVWSFNDHVISDLQIRLNLTGVS